MWIRLNLKTPSFKTANAAVDMPIIFESGKLGAFKTTIQYSLNKCFTSSLAMSVNVVRPYLKLMHTQVSMRFDSRYGGKTIILLSLLLIRIDCIFFSHYINYCSVLLHHHPQHHQHQSSVFSVDYFETCFANVFYENSNKTRYGGGGGVK